MNHTVNKINTQFGLFQNEVRPGVFEQTHFAGMLEGTKHVLLRVF